MLPPRPLPRCAADDTAPPRRDAGVTLLEVVIAVSVMSILGAFATAALVSAFGAAATSEAASTARGQLDLAFVRLDRQLRYAWMVSEPATVAGDAYVEFLTRDDGVATCHQLRWRSSTGRLEQRSWPQAGAPDDGGPWTRLADSLVAAPVAAGGATPVTPFQRLDADGRSRYQRLRIAVAADRAPASQDPRLRTTVTFTALNTMGQRGDDTTCTEGRAP